MFTTQIFPLNIHYYENNNNNNNNTRAKDVGKMRMAERLHDAWAAFPRRSRGSSPLHVCLLSRSPTLFF